MSAAAAPTTLRLPEPQPLWQCRKRRYGDIFSLGSSEKATAAQIAKLKTAGNFAAAFDRFDQLPPLFHPSPLYPWLASNESEIERTVAVVSHCLPQRLSTTKKNVLIGTSGFFLLDLLGQCIAANPTMDGSKIAILIVDNSLLNRVLWKNIARIICENGNRLEAIDQIAKDILSNYDFYYERDLSKTTRRLNCLFKEIISGRSFLSREDTFQEMRARFKKGDFRHLLLDFSDVASMQLLHREIVGMGGNIALFYGSNVCDYVPHEMYDKTVTILTQSNPLALVIDARDQPKQSLRQHIKEIGAPRKDLSALLPVKCKPLPYRQKRELPPTLYNQQMTGIVARVGSYLTAAEQVYLLPVCTLIGNKARWSEQRDHLASFKASLVADFGNTGEIARIGRLTRGLATYVEENAKAHFNARAISKCHGIIVVNGTGKLLTLVKNQNDLVLQINGRQCKLAGKSDVVLLAGIQNKPHEMLLLACELNAQAYLRVFTLTPSATSLSYDAAFLSTDVFRTLNRYLFAQFMT